MLFYKLTQGEFEYALLFKTIHLFLVIINSTKPSLNTLLEKVRENILIQSNPIQSNLFFIISLHFHFFMMGQEKQLMFQMISKGFLRLLACESKF